MKFNYLFLFILFTINSYAQAPDEELFVAWGTNPHNLHYLDEPGAKFGPQSFQRIKNTIAILDPANNAIKTFENRKYIQEYYAPSSSKDFSMNNKGEISFIVGNDIQVYKDDKLQFTYSNPEKRSSFEEIRRINNSYAIKNSNSNFWTLIKNKFSIFLKKTSNIPKSGRVKLISKTSAEIYLNNDNDSSIVIVNHLEPALGSMRFLGSDKYNRIFTDVNIIIQQVPLRISRHIWILNNLGKKIAIIDLPNHYFTSINRDIEIYENGTIFHMLSSKEGIYIYKWQIPENTIDFHGTYPEKFKKKVAPHTLMESNEPVINFYYSQAKQSISREKTLQIADTYVQHQWACKSSNMTNGTQTAPDGDLVKTPSWLKIGTNQKIPYKWGGFDLLPDYDNGLTKNHYAGDTHTDGVSSYARGVDCSGFVSRCWQLKTHYSTRMMDNPNYGSIVQKYNSWAELKPSDAIHKHGHVILFVKHNSNGSLSCVEAAASQTDWKVDYSTHYLHSLDGYSPVYFKNMEGAVLATPGNIILQVINATTINIKFSKVEKADEYIIYYGNDNTQLQDSVVTASNEVNLSSLKEKTIYYFKVKARNTEISSILSNEVFAAATSDNNSSVLIVNGFDRATNTRHDYITKYSKPVSGNGYGFSYVLNESVIDEKISLLDFHTVIWILGDESSADHTFNSKEQWLVQEYLKQGGNLFVSGSEIGWDLEGKANHPTQADKAFYHNFLKAKYHADAPLDKKASYYSIESISNSIFDNVDSFNFDDGTHGTIDVDWPDAILPVNGSNSCFKFKNVSASNGVAGIQYSGLFPDGTKSGKLVYFTFPFETVYPETKRIEIMEKALSFFDTINDIDKDDNPSIALEYALYQNYPNPFNPSTNIKYQLSQDSYVKLTIYDIAGKQVKSLVNRHQSPGQYNATWSPDGLSSGMYIYQIQIYNSDKSKINLSQSKKCVLLK